MKPIFKNIIAIILGWLGGSVVNMALIKMGQRLFSVEGIDMNDMDALAKVMPTLDFEYFIFPFLAHAIGTLIGAIIASYLAANRKMQFAIVVGVLFLLGGIVLNFLLPAPIGYVIIDIILAYIPMAWLGGKITMKMLEKIKKRWQ